MAVPPSAAAAGAVDHAVVLDADGLFLSGWVGGVDAGAELRLVGATRGDGRIDLDYRFRRPDLEDAGYPGRPHGFACMAEAPGAALRATDLRVEIVGPGGASAALGIPEPIVDPVAGRRHLLGLLELGGASDQFMARHVFPAVERLRSRIEPGLAIGGIRDRGVVPGHAEVSVVIPIYGSLDLLTPQIALLSRDPDLHRTEIVLVLDSPELDDEFSALTHHLHQLYGLPLRTISLTRNTGFVYANNLAVGHTSGEFLLLLNSDVFPDRNGWLQALTAALREDPRTVAAGPKLLFEDRSVQHAGMYFERDTTGRWENLHFHKGMPESLPAVNEARRVPALTAACVLVARSAFTEAGGFDPAYALGDYEDSDLCMRLRESGRECRYVPDAQLFHLERQSFSRAQTGRVAYNRWLFNHRWGAQIEQLMHEFSGDHPGERPAPAGGT